jgi:integrative and conjugative element protein (TIGR02256 family)
MPVPLSTAIVWLHESIRDDLIKQAGSHAPNETGGILLGYRHSATEVVITDAIGPGPTADHRRTGFRPDAQWQTRELARRYHEAGRRIEYLGDWHTHPGGTTTPSSTDRRTLHAIARHPEARCPQPIMAIIAAEHPWTLAIRQSSPRSLRRSRLTVLAIQLYQ